MISYNVVVRGDAVVLPPLFGPPCHWVLEGCGGVVMRRGEGSVGTLVRGGRVLLVEDDFLMSEATRALLHGLDLEVGGVCTEAGEAVALLDRECFDAAILDVRVGDGEVWPVAERLMADGVPFVFLTGYGRPDRVPSSLRDVPLLLKPVNAESLFEALLEAARRVG